jgi:hypothetical protein
LATSGVLSRLSELLLVEAVRHYASALPEGGAGWLKGLKDPQVARALALIHRDLGAPWSAEGPRAGGGAVAQRLRGPLHRPRRRAARSAT